MDSTNSTIGRIFREARGRKGVSLSAAAAATRMKIQTIEAMERDDFSRIPARSYARGFIKLYAEYLGLDPEPLLQHYRHLYAPLPLEERPRLPVPPSRWQSKIRLVVSAIQKITPAIALYFGKMFRDRRVLTGLTVVVLALVMIPALRWLGAKRADAYKTSTPYSVPKTLTEKTSSPPSTGNNTPSPKSLLTVDALSLVEQPPEPYYDRWDVVVERP